MVAWRRDISTFTCINNVINTQSTLITRENILQTTEKEKLSLSVRIIVGTLSLPSLLLAFMLVSEALKGNFDSIGAFEFIYALVGFFAIYIALTGRKFF